METISIEEEMISSFFSYLKYEKRRPHNTIVSYKKDIDDFMVIVRSNGLTISEINHKWANRIIMELRERLGTNSVRRKVYCYKTFYNHCWRREYLSHNPFQRVKNVTIPKKIPSYLPEEVVLQTIDSIASDTLIGIRDKAIIELIYASGCRINEICNLKLDDVDWENNLIKVTSKGDRERLVPIPQFSMEVVQWYLFTWGIIDGYVLRSKRTGKLNSMQANRIIRKYFNRSWAGLFSPHSLRHSLATHMMVRGAPIKGVKDILGHISMASTVLYTHIESKTAKEYYDLAHPRA